MHDEPKAQQKKRSLFSRFGDSAEEKAEKAANAEAKPQTAGNRFLSGFTGGRRRGQSGTGSELASMQNQPKADVKIAAPVEAN